MSSDTETKPFTGAWFFEQIEYGKLLRAIEPSGRVHLVKLGDMNSLAGIRLLNAMVRDLMKKEKT